MIMWSKQLSVSSFLKNLAHAQYPSGNFGMEKHRKLVLQSKTVITKWDRKPLLQSYYKSVAELSVKELRITKCEKVLLQSALGITKCDRLFLQSASVITKCDSCYKLRYSTGQATYLSGLGCRPFSSLKGINLGILLRYHNDSLMM